MQQVKNAFNLRGIVGRVASKAPTINILGYALAGDGMARVTAEITHTSESRADSNVVALALRDKLQGRMQAVAGSFATLEKDAFREVITGIVGCVRDIQPVTPDLKGFRATAANMFMDDEKDMWVLRKTEAGQILVKTTGIDDDVSLVNLLDSVSTSSWQQSARHGAFAAHASSAQPSEVAGGDFVSYVGFNQVCHGFVLATTDDGQALVLSQESDEPEAIKVAAVTQVHDQTNFPEVQVDMDTAVASSRAGVGLSTLVNFYKKVYGHNSEFYKEFVARLQGHAFY